MKIIHLYKDYFPPTVGGIEQTVGRLARWSVSHGHQVTVLTSNPGSRRTLRETVDGVRVIRCAEWARVWSTPFGPDMAGELARLDADLYHLHYPSPPGEVSWVLTRPRGATVVTWHSDVIRQKLVMPIYGHVVHALVKSAVLVMPTFAGMAEASPILCHYPEKVRVVPLGTDLEDYVAPGPDAPEVAALRARVGAGPVVLFVGRVVMSKGIEVLLDAARDIEARIVIVGDGPELPALRARAEQLALGVDRVLFTGRVSPERVREWVALATVGVLPSIYEAYGLAMVEIMSNGVPMICTELGTGTTYINRPGETGLAVAPGDPVALASALNQLLRDEPLRRRMGDAARRRARECFSTAAMMQRICAVYDEAIALSSRPSRH